MMTSVGTETSEAMLLYPGPDTVSKVQATDWPAASMAPFPWLMTPGPGSCLNARGAFQQASVRKC